jgi:hypothetical protein
VVGLFIGAAVVGVIALFYVMGQDAANQSVNSQGDSVDPNTVPQPDATNYVMALARGIARGEGFYVSGSLPHRSNNPGDLTKSFGFNTTGVANKEGVLIFESVEGGWGALYGQLGLIFDGTSKAYNTDMTVWEFAYTWTLGREPRNDSENASVGGWAAAVLEEVNKAAGTTLTAQSTLGDISA